MYNNLIADLEKYAFSKKIVSEVYLKRDSIDINLCWSINRGHWKKFLRRLPIKCCSIPESPVSGISSDI